MTESVTLASAPDPLDFETFSTVCAGLPHIKPRTNQVWLRDVYDTALLQGEATATVAEQEIPVSELAELFIEVERRGYSAQVVSPAGAQLLVRLYNAGALELTGKHVPAEISASLQAYCSSTPALVEKAQARAALHVEQQAAAQAYLARLADLPSINEAEFNYGLLNEIFWQHLGKGEGTLVIGGVPVHKSLTRHTSNSGKTLDYAVRFTWTGAEGTPKHVEKPSMFADNRRNDPDRNWGLPGSA